MSGQGIPKISWKGGGEVRQVSSEADTRGDGCGGGGGGIVKVMIAYLAGSC